jgi:hypothetical protein
MTELSQKHFDDLYYAVGFITVHWAFVEKVMDDCITIIYHNYEGKTFFTDPIPKTQLTNKIILLKKYFNKLPKLIKYKDIGLKLINTIKDLSSNRHWFIHGVIVKLEPEFLHFIKYQYGNEIHKIEYRGFQPTDLPVYGKKIQDLLLEFAPFVQDLVNKAALEKSGPQ